PAPSSDNSSAPGLSRCSVRQRQTKTPRYAAVELYASQLCTRCRSSTPVPTPWRSCARRSVHPNRMATAAPTSPSPTSQKAISRKTAFSRRNPSRSKKVLVSQSAMGKCTTLGWKSIRPMLLFARPLNLHIRPRAFEQAGADYHYLLLRLEFPPVLLHHPAAHPVPPEVHITPPVYTRMHAAQDKPADPEGKTGGTAHVATAQTTGTPCSRRTCRC